jgi:hypothetical protein
MKKGNPTHRDKIMAGLEKAAAKGRKPGRPPTVSDGKIRTAIPLGTTKGAAKVGLSVSTFIRRRRKVNLMVEKTPTTVPIGRAEVYLRWIYEARGLSMLTRAAKADFAGYVAQQAALDQAAVVSIYDLPRNEI